MTCPWASRRWGGASPSPGRICAAIASQLPLNCATVWHAGQWVLAYKVFRCWVSEFQSLPDLDANANAVAIQHIKLENEGWERDYDVTEPSEPSFSEPA